MYRYKSLDFKSVEDGYAYVAETFWGRNVLIRIDDHKECIWLRFHYANTENVGDEDGFYNQPIFVKDMEAAIREADKIYERCLSQQFNIISPQNGENTSKPI